MFCVLYFGCLDLQRKLRSHCTSPKPGQGGENRFVLQSTRPNALFAIGTFLFSLSTWMVFSPCFYLSDGLGSFSVVAYCNGFRFLFYIICLNTIL